MPAALAAEAGLLVAAERRGRVEPVERVRPDDAGPQLRGHPQDARALLRPDARPTARTGCCWPSRRPRPGVRNVSTDSTGPKISSRAMRCACETSVKTVGGNQKPRSGSSHGGDQRVAPSASPASASSRMRASCAAELIAPMSVFLSSGSPSRSVASRRCSARDQLVGDRLLHEQPRARAADVALVEEDAVDDALDGLVERRVVEDDVGRLAAELERQPLAGAGQRALDDLADLGRAGERDLVDAGVLDDAPARSPGRRPGC